MAYAHNMYLYMSSATLLCSTGVLYLVNALLKTSTATIAKLTTLLRVYILVCPILASTNTAVTIKYQLN